MKQRGWFSLEKWIGHGYQVILVYACVKGWVCTCVFMCTICVRCILFSFKFTTLDLISSWTCALAKTTSVHAVEFCLQQKIQLQCIWSRLVFCINDKSAFDTVDTAFEDLLRLSCFHSWMLCVCMRVCSRRRLEGHGAERTFIEDLTVNALDVGFYSCNISEDHTAVDTAGGRRNKSSQKSDLNKIVKVG